MKLEGELIWQSPAPNSTSFARPISLARAEESREVLSVELEPSFSVIREDYNTRFSIGRKFAEVRCQTKCSMIDGKMVSLLQGDSGAFCHLFHNTRADCNSTLMIAEGFNINKDYATCQEAWEKLVSGEIQYCSSERRGQFHESIVKTDLYCFSVLHSSKDLWTLHRKFCTI